MLNVLQALNIETEEDIHLLASYFMHLRGKPDQGEEEKVSNYLRKEGNFFKFH